MAAAAWLMTSLFVSTTAVAGLVSVINNNDSLVYHVARIAHWAQSGSVAFYATGTNEQNYLSPGAEIIQLHVYLLTGNDHSLALVQSLALLVCALTASEFALLLGVGRRGQAFAALLFTTSPVALLEASSTRNDLIAAAWVAVAVVGLKGAYASLNSAAAWLTYVICTSAIGLAVATKVPSLFFLVPFLALWFFSRDNLSHFITRATVAVIGIAVVVLFSAPNFIQNRETYGDALGPAYLTKAGVIGDKTPGKALAVALRYSFSQLATPSVSVNRDMTTVEDRIEQSTGLTKTRASSDYAPATTPYQVFWQPGEDFVGAPIQALAIMLALCYSVLRAQKLGFESIATSVALLVGILLICGSLRWQIYGDRFFLPTFLLGGGLVARLLSVKPALVRRLLAMCIIIPAVTLGAYIVIYNQSRPLAGTNSIFRRPRASQILTGPNQYLQSDYLRTAALAAAVHPRVVGLRLGEFDLEYVYWQLLHGGVGGPKFVNIGSDPASGGSGGPAVPDVVICTICRDHVPPWLLTSEWRRQAVDNFSVVYRRVER